MWMARPPASASENRTHDAEKIGLSRYSDFFNRIGQEETDARARRAPLPLSAPIRETASVIGYSANQARIAKRSQSATIIDVRRLEKE